MAPGRERPEAVERLRELLVYIAVEWPFFSLLVDAPLEPWSLVGCSPPGVEYAAAHELLSRVAWRFSTDRFVVHTDDLVLYHALTGEFDFHAQPVPFEAWRGLCGETGSAVEYVRVSARRPHPWQDLARAGLERARTISPGVTQESVADWV